MMVVGISARYVIDEYITIEFEVLCWFHFVRVSKACAQ